MKNNMSIALCLLSSMLCVPVMQASKSHVIDKVPFRICESGKWFVVKDLVYDGSANAITIAASNVTLNFNNHDLRLKDAAATAVLISDVSEVTLENDSIAYDALSDADSSAVHVVNATKVKLDNLLIKNANIALLVENSSDVTLVNSQIREATSAHVQTIGSDGIVINKSYIFNTLENLAIGGVRFETTNNIKLTNTDLHNSDVFFVSGAGLLVDQLTSLIDDPAYQFTNFQVGSASETVFAQNTIIRNSTFDFTVGGVGSSGGGISFAKADGALLQDSVIAVNNSIFEDSVSAKISIGQDAAGQFSSSRNITVSNCILANTARGIWAESPANDRSSGIVIKDCLIETSNDQGILLGNASDVTIQNNSISNGGGIGNGIEFSAGCRNVALLNNVISDNAGTGILLAVDSLNTHVQGNNVFGNAGDGINVPVTAATTKTYFNTSCNNGGINCVNVKPAQLAGSPALAGSNICCTNTVTKTQGKAIAKPVSASGKQKENRQLRK